ncbi:MAG: Ni,Fe-hydrogenase III large subunit [Desulfobacteraceae bacterium 4572_35.1]|nr:MAG: Ni,Fe-hydrogenase III large subunit [Desulfobacteraceae bacterium 4572_35.1]
MSGRQEYTVTSGKVVDLKAQLLKQGLAVESAQVPAGPVLYLEVLADDWGRVARVAVDLELRWSAVWGEHHSPQLLVTSLIAGCDGHILLRTMVSENQSRLPSQTPYFPAANRPERHLQDMFGVQFVDHPDGRRWIRHQGWAEGEFPLRKDFPVAGNPAAETPPDCSYTFEPVTGEGVYEVPVGPVHAGIIEPGHFRFQAIGEDMLYLEEHLGYVHKGIEKLAEGRDLAGLARLAGRISGDSSVGHCWAACQAAERALGVEVPARALYLRAIMAERERIANHIGDIGAICNDVGFTFALVQGSKIRERWQRNNATVFGHRLLMDRIIPGGVCCDIDPSYMPTLRAEIIEVRAEVEELMPMLLEYPSLQDRLRTTGILSPPYPPYDTLEVEVPAYIDGDVAKRTRVRGDEILISLTLLENLLENLPAGELMVDCHNTGAECDGVGLIEGWRGEIVAYLRLDADGKVLRYFPRDPSWLNWPALEELIHNNIVPDFPVCNKSVNGSYSGQDL